MIYRKRNIHGNNRNPGNNSNHKNVTNQKYLQEGEQSTQIRKNIKEIYYFLLCKSRLCYTVTGDVQIRFNP